MPPPIPAGYVPPTRPTPPGPAKVPLTTVDAVPMKVDWPIYGLPEPDWCDLCFMWVYECEDSEAFCNMKLCKFKARAKRRAKSGTPPHPLTGRG